MGISNARVSPVLPSMRKMSIAKNRAKILNQNQRDIGAPGRIQTFEQPWCVDPIMAQCSQEGRGVPMAMRNLGEKPHTAWLPAAQRRHIGLGPGLVDEDQTLRRDLVLIFGPLRPPSCDVGTVALPSHHGFF